MDDRRQNIAREKNVSSRAAGQDFLALTLALCYSERDRR